MIQTPPLQIEAMSPGQRIKDRWRHVIHDLEIFFSNAQLPTGRVRISRNETIDDVPFMVQHHLEAIRSQQGSPHIAAYVQQLQKLKTYLIEQNHYKRIIR